MTTSLHDDFILRSAKLADLAKLTKEMRQHQNKYFTTRSKFALRKALRAEQKVDALLRDLKI